MNHLTAENQAIALDLISKGQDFTELDNNLLMVVAWDNSVWVCDSCGVSLNDAKMIQRIL